MSILNILLCVGVVNLISPAFGDISPDLEYYNPVAAILIPPSYSKDKTWKSCPGAMVWVKSWQVFIGSNTCIKNLTHWYSMRVRVGGNVSDDAFFNEPLRSTSYRIMSEPLGVALIFIRRVNRKYAPFPMTSLFMAGILQKNESEGKNHLPITISQYPWGPHHEVMEDNGGPKEIVLNFTERLTSNETCPEEVEWGPAMRPSRWSVPLIIGVLKSSSPSTVKDGVCKVSLIYTSIIPAVKWIEEKVTGFYVQLHQFEQHGKSEDDLIKHLQKTEESKQ